VKKNTIFIFIFNFLFFNQSSNALRNTHKSFLHDDYCSSIIPRQGGHEGGGLSTDNAQPPSPIESCVTQKKPLQSKNLEMQEVIRSLQKTLASQSETLQTKEELLQITQTDLQKTRIFAENQRRESELIRAQLADLEQKNREAEEKKEAQKHLIKSLQNSLKQLKRKYAKVQDIIKDGAEMDRSLLEHLDAIRFIPPQFRGNHEVKDNSTSKVFLQPENQSQPKAYLRKALDVQDSEAQDSEAQDSEEQDFDLRQEWEDDF